MTIKLVLGNQKRNLYKTVMTIKESQSLIIEPRLKPGANHYKVYYKPSYHGRNYGVVTEISWFYPEEVNEWLTNNCTGYWGFYVEQYIVDNLLRWKFIDDILDKCKPYIGFQNRDDAILFKLNI